MAPRAYRLGRRAQSAAATRERIVDAAAALYQDQGVNATTLQAIADRADVSRGTLLHHFGGAAGILEAVAERILVTLELPDEHIFDGIDGEEARLRAYVVALNHFFQRSIGWWAIFVSEMQRPELQAREAEYYERMGRLQTLALGDLAGNRDVNIVVGSLIHPGTIGGLTWVLRQAGLNETAIDEALGDIVVAYVERARLAPQEVEPGERRVRE